MSAVQECICLRRNLSVTTIRERKTLHRKTSVIFLLASILLMQAALAPGAKGSPKKKTASPKKDPLADYLQKVSGPVQANINTNTLGSLWTDNGRLANLVTDYKASRVGDLVTISVSQNLSSTNTGNVATNRTFSASSGITALGGHIKTSGVASLFSPTSTQALTGKAQATSTTALSTTLTGRVVAVLPSGTLVVEAERQIVMNDQREIVILRGMVRTGDLDATNTVASNQVGNLEVEVKGKGIISEGVRSPSPVMKWILRIVGF
jgi:flagellar L-ring protein precursor FlgH